MALERQPAAVWMAVWGTAPTPYGPCFYLRVPLVGGTPDRERVVAVGQDPQVLSGTPNSADAALLAA